MLLLLQVLLALLLVTIKVLQVPILGHQNESSTSYTNMDNTGISTAIPAERTCYQQYALRQHHEPSHFYHDKFPVIQKWVTNFLFCSSLHHIFFQFLNIIHLILYTTKTPHFMLGTWKENNFDIFLTFTLKL